MKTAAQQDMELLCREIGVVLHRACPDGVGFFLSLFQLGDGGWSTYMSNGQRHEMVTYLRELADQLERTPMVSEARS